ncbi:uncharacterized protein [Littorina saxatilis]|uniref:Uncharacterized protein n=1 Tax=Littorina saxatilis TaxID=31220 RepID=A0AAN9GAC8_9CAEN
MSALPRRGAHVRDLFVNQTAPNLGMGSFESDQNGSRKSYDLGGSKKKKRAPAPPVSAGLGQYKPRILSDESVTNVPSNLSVDNPVRPPRPSKNKVDNPLNNFANTSHNSDVSRPIIMGDKDTPLVLHPTPDPDDLDFNVIDISLSSDGAPLTLNSEGMPGRGQDGLGTENPLFQMHEEEQEAAIDLTVTADQAANEKVFDFSGSADEVTNGTETSHLNGIFQFGADRDPTENEEPEGIFIPPPDYDEEEKTMVFDEEDLEAGTSSSPRRGQKVFKEYYGEDYAQYLSDEETGPHKAATVRPRRLHHNNVVDRKTKTEAKRPHYKKRESIAGKGKKDKSFTGSNSLRNFSFADSKFGTITGSKKRQHSIPSVSEETDEAELFVSTGESYEQFLRMKNGEDLTNESTGPTYGFQGGGFLAGHPLGMPSDVTRTPKEIERDNVWKKLTQRFRNRRSVDLS